MTEPPNVLLRLPIRLIGQELVSLSVAELTMRLTTSPVLPPVVIPTVCVSIKLRRLALLSEINIPAQFLPTALLPAHCMGVGSAYWVGVGVLVVGYPTPP